jgi:hypothetical protein
VAWIKNEITSHLVKHILDALQGTYPSREFKELEENFHQPQGNDTKY